GSLTRADTLLKLVKAQQFLDRGGSRRAEVGEIDQILQIVGESVVDILDAAIVRAAFQRIAVLENAVVVATDPIVRERVVHPLADLMGGGRNILRERARIG